MLTIEIVAVGDGDAFTITSICDLGLSHPPTV